MPVLTLTVSGRSTASAMPATSFASLAGLRSSADPMPRLVASAACACALLYPALSTVWQQLLPAHPINRLQEHFGKIMVLQNTS